MPDSGLNYESTPLPGFNPPISGPGSQGVPSSGSAGSVFISDSSSFALSYNLEKGNIAPPFAGQTFNMNICYNGQPAVIQLYCPSNTPTLS